MFQLFNSYDSEVYKFINLNNFNKIIYYNLDGKQIVKCTKVRTIERGSEKTRERPLRGNLAI